MLLVHGADPNAGYLWEGLMVRAAPASSEIKDWLPAVRTTRPRSLGPVAAQQLHGRVDVAGRGDRVDARARKPLVLIEQRLRALEPSRIAIPIVQAREPQELVDHRLVVRERLADGLMMWRAGVARDELEVRLELGRAREPELTGDD